jgi:hypothetical protein
MKGRDRVKHNSEKVIVTLLNESSISRAANKLKVDESTIFRMMQNPEFMSAYNDAKRRMLDNTLNAIQAASGEALETIKSIMNDSSSPRAIRLSAAKTILELSFRAFESQQMEQRISEIESTLTNKSNQPISIRTNWG